MDFTLSDEQTMLADMVTRLFEHDHDLQTRRRRLNGEACATDGLWGQLGELGVLGVMLPESHGGMGASAQEAAIGSHLVAQAMGRFLVTDPFVSHAVVAAPLLAETGTAAQQAAWLPRAAAGQARLVLAHDEDAAGAAVAVPRLTQAAPAGDGFRLSGVKRGIVDAGGADGFLVTARTAAGLGLFIVPKAAPGLALTTRVAFDGGDVGELVLADVPVAAADRLGSDATALPAVQRAIERGITALLAEAVGAMDQLRALCIEHLKTRRQFGQPLARFQALQHHVADMATAIEQARSMALRAVAASVAADAAERRRGISAAKALVGRHALAVGRLAVQLHGGMGMTEEVPVGHYVRRLMAIDAQWGPAEAHLGLCADDLPR